MNHTRQRVILLRHFCLLQNTNSIFWKRSIEIRTFSSSASATETLHCAGGMSLQIRQQKIHLPEEQSLYSIRIPEFSSALIRSKLEGLHLDNKLYFPLSTKAMESPADFRLFIGLFRDGILKAQSETGEKENASISILMQEWIRKTKQVDEAYEILMDFHNVNPSGFRGLFAKNDLIHFTINGLCFRKMPFEAFTLFNAVVPVGEPAFFQDEKVQEMIKMISVSFAWMKSTEFMLVLWNSVTEWFSSGSTSLYAAIPSKLLTIFVNYFGRCGEKEKVVQIFEIWRRNTDLYDAKFYNQLCHAYNSIGGDLETRLKMLLLNNPYSELDPRIIHFVIKTITRDYGRKAALAFVEELFTKQKHLLNFDSKAFGFLAYEIGRMVKVHEMQQLIKLLEEKGNVLIDDFLVTQLYSGLKRFTRQVTAKERQECLDFIKFLCSENNISLLYSLKEKPEAAQATA
jgi:hypothetical protein